MSAGQRAVSPNGQINQKLIGVKGWLLFFCINLTILGPLAALAQIGQAGAGLLPMIGTVSGIERFFLAIVALTAGLTVASIAIGIALWRRMRGAHIWAQRYLVVVFIAVCVGPFLIFLFVETEPGAAATVLDAAIFDILKTLIVTGVWSQYLLRSKRVQANFVPGARKA